MSNLNRNQIESLGKYCLLLFLIIGICAISIRMLTRSESLSDYDAKRKAEHTVQESVEEQADSVQGDAALQGDFVQDDSIPEPEGEQSDAVQDVGEIQNDSVQDTAPQESVDPKSTTASSATNVVAMVITQSVVDSLHPSNYGEPPMEDRVTYQDGFYYESLSENVKARITGVSFPEGNTNPGYDGLRYLGLKYNDFEGKEQNGELICNKAIAQDLIEIFYELFESGYQFERIELVDNYGGDDTASMLANNTSCFNYREVEGTTSLSKHALGLAIDINPFYNPYIVYGKGENGGDYISPKGSEAYVDRTASFPYKIDESDLCYKLFIEHGFFWGGNWNSQKDYQHFQKKI